MFPFAKIDIFILSKGGVEGTRLEAKAKDTKKSEAKAKGSPSEDRLCRDPGQECSRSRPRTKDTGSSVLEKKKIFFLAISKKKGLQKNFC